MKKVLFLIHDLGHGGAEKVLVNLVNNMDKSQFDVSVTAMFGGGVNEQFLSPDIHFRTVFPRMIPGNSKWMKLFSPALLHSLMVKEHYDIEVAYLEGPAVRVIAGCPDMSTKKAAWIHCTMHSPKQLARSFRSSREAKKCYGAIDRVISVADTARQAFLKACTFPAEKSTVLYNTNESDKILRMSKENAPELIEDGAFRWIGVGKLAPVKGFDRMLRIQKRIADAGKNAHLYILGEGDLRKSLQSICEELGITGSVTFLGYQTNPYKYVSKCDLFVCASFSEGFSTAATEALIVGTPVCTVEVSGMKEMLGENNEYGVVTENSEDALYEGIKSLLDDPALLANYKEQAQARGKVFRTEQTVEATQNFLLSLL